MTSYSLLANTMSLIPKIISQMHNKQSKSFKIIMFFGKSHTHHYQLLLKKKKEFTHASSGT